MNDENNFENVMNRIKSLIKSNKDSDLALSLGLSSSGYANAKKRQVLPFDKIFDFSNSRNVNMDWLLTGEGTMLKGGGGIIGMNIKQKALFEGYNYLSEQQQDEVLAVISEKKRINDLEMAVKTMQGKM